MYVLRNVQRERKVVCYQLELGNNLPTFWLNVPVVIRAKVSYWKIQSKPRQVIASSPGPFQILSRSHGEKSREGLRSKLCHGPEMMNSVSTSWTQFVLPSPPFPVRDVVLVPGLLPVFLHGCEIKSGSGLGTRLGKLFSELKLVTDNLSLYLCSSQLKSHWK